MDPKTVVEPVIEQLETAWNAGDGTAYAAPFTPDADFVNIRGELHSGQENIGAGHQGIFNSIYKGSNVDYTVVKARELRDGEILAHVSGKLHVPDGPLAGDLEAIGTVLLVPDGEDHRIAAYHNTLVAG
jgi:uncharacterized protein (TIGR02246 family)